MDEAITIMEFASRPTSFDVYLCYNIPNNHILFTIVLQLWMDLLDLGGCLNPFMLRVPSMLFGLLAIGMLCLASARRGGLVVGGALTAFFALSPTFALYSTAVRGYMLGLLCVAATLFLVKPMLRRGGLCFYSVHFLISLIAVGTIPTNVIALEAAGLVSLPFAWRRGDRRARIIWLFSAPVVALALFYLPILPKFIRSLTLGEGWGSSVSAAWNLYGAFALSFLLLLPFCVYGAISLWKRIPARRFDILCMIAVFLLPLPFLFLSKTVPFPRVFLPLWGVWIVVLARPLRESFRLLKENCPQLKPALLCGILLCGCAFMAFQARSAVRDLVFGGGDDLFMPRYMEPGFHPDLIAKRVSEMVKENPDLKVFLSFDSDYFAILMHGSMLSVPEGTWLYDSPRLGKVLRLPADAYIVCAGQDDLFKTLVRFGLKDPKLVFNAGIQQIYEVDFKTSVK